MPPVHKKRLSKEETTEIITGSINLVVNIGFIFGSIFFLPNIPEIFGYESAYVGDILFIIGAMIGFILAVRSLYLTHEAGKTREVVASRIERNEYFETVLYAVAAAIFFCGSLLFFPPFLEADWQTEETKFAYEKVGAHLFAAGSLGYVMAGFYNGFSQGAHAQEIDKSIDTTAEELIHYLKKYGLLCVVIGSCLFVTGSFMYRPGFAQDCNDETIPQGNTTTTDEGEVNHLPCVSIMDFGTYCYIVGSVLFTVDSIFELVVVYLRTTQPEEDSDASDAEGDDDEDDKLLPTVDQ